MVPDLLSKKKIGELFRKYRACPSKKLGQNLLIDKSIIKKFLKAAELRPNDIVLEIGPGIGNLTQELAKKVKKVIAVEKDSKMVEILKHTLKNFGNVEVIHGDIIKMLPQNSKFQIPKTYKVVANLPFYLAVLIIRKFLESVEIRLQQAPVQQAPKEMVFFVQKEVAQRICAKPPYMNFLAVLVQFYARPEIISYVSKKSFWPQPKVDSAIVRITPISNKYTMVERLLRRDLFFKIVRAGFSHPRKQILNNLASGLKLDKEGAKDWLLKNEVEPTERAERLNIENWIRLTKSFK